MMLKYLRASAPPVLWAAFIFILSSQQVLPGIQVSVLDFFLKKIAHMFVYGVLYHLTSKALADTLDPRHAPQVWWLALVIVIAYAISDEIHQSLIPNRHATVRDIGYDILGVSLVILRKARLI